MAETCILVKLAATKASASLHRHIKMAISIIAGIASSGSPVDSCAIWSFEMYCFTSAASTAPRMRKTVISTKSWRAVAEMLPSRWAKGFRGTGRPGIASGDSPARSAASTVVGGSIGGRFAGGGIAIAVNRLVPCLNHCP